MNAEPRPRSSSTADAGGIMQGAPHGHLALLASAGSGKTARLCHRYIQLLADKHRKITPDRICALTFTRKAAGEIFDKIVECLCLGAANSEGAATLAGRLDMPGLDRHQFARLLRLFLDHLHRAVIGTMDSFVVGVARAFPTELGIPMDFQVADAHDAEGRAMRQDILADLLGAPGGDRGAQEFLEAFKQATFGVEEKSLAYFINIVVPAFHLAYRFCRDKNRWGNDTLIWAGRNRSRFRAYSQVDLAAASAVVETWIHTEQQLPKGLDKRLLTSLEAIRGALAGYSPTTPWSERFSGTLFDQLLDQRSALRQGEADLVYYAKPAPIADDAARALALLLDNLVAVEIHRALEKTRGLHDVLELYDRAYEHISRVSGRFSFTDLQYLLAPGYSSRSVASISRERQEDRLFIDYRMDGRLDHWLLDEFQDTSDLQWAIFNNLVSELVQGDPQGHARSFFYVGDIKQSIYRWRGGNPGLFLDLHAQYNQAGEVIRLESISKTRRCSLAVVDAVNGVFSDLPADKLPAGTLAAWRTAWSRHETFNREAPGHAALLEHLPNAETSEAQDAEARYRLVADLLNEIQPVRRGIGVGILTRDNRACSDLVNVLRRECPGIGFVHEGKAGIVENELAQAMLALVRLAAHPGDEFAWQHVRMSPLARALDRQKLTRNNIAPRLLTEIESRGFRCFIGEWGLRLETVCPLNEYGRQCLARLEKAAAEFDVGGSRNCNRFLEFAGDYEIHGQAARGSVRIMTIHQAKGLGFDMVILPQLQHRTRMNMARAEAPEMLYGGTPFDPDWILRSPKRLIAEHDPVLKRRLRQADEEHGFDWLCLLYVAMTRAKYALYMITSPAKDSKTFRPASLLKLRLTGPTALEAESQITINAKKCLRLYQSNAGRETWYETFPVVSDRVSDTAPVGPDSADIAGRASRRKVLQRSEPSEQESSERRASELFKPERRDVLDFGSAIHELFETIEWLDQESDTEALLEAWHPVRPRDPQVDHDVRTQFRGCLQSSDVQKALARPAGNVELWREKSFEIILDEQWISGVFDRVVITRDGSGKPVSAVILDYKSNRNLDTEARLQSMAGYYRSQMELYRRALSVILGLTEERIVMQLLFTVPARTIILTSAPNGAA